MFGGGGVAERKVRVLLKCQARVKVCSPKLNFGLKRLLKNKKIVWRKDASARDLLRGVFLAVAATNNRAVNSRVAFSCRKKNILVNVVDVPGESNFIVPAFIEKNGLVFAISTSGQAPCLAKKIRQDLTSNFLPGYSRMLKELAGERNKLKGSCLGFSQRKSALNKLINSKFSRLARS